MIASGCNDAIHAVKAVYCNGRLVNNVVYADDLAGEVIYNPLDREGYFMEMGDELVTTTETGHIQIELHVGWGYDPFRRRFIIVRPQ